MVGMLQVTKPDIAPSKCISNYSGSPVLLWLRECSQAELGARSELTRAVVLMCDIVRRGIGPVKTNGELMTADEVKGLGCFLPRNRLVVSSILFTLPNGGQERITGWLAVAATLTWTDIRYAKVRVKADYKVNERRRTQTEGGGVSKRQKVRMSRAEYDTALEAAIAKTNGEVEKAVRTERNRSKEREDVLKGRIETMLRVFSKKALAPITKHINVLTTSPTKDKIVEMALDWVFTDNRNDE